jgi:iron complex outermembrane receptor protein
VTGASTASPEEFSMRQSNLLTGVSVCALAFVFAAVGNAQEALPAIDVGSAAPAPAAPIAPPSPPAVEAPAKPFTESRVPASVSHVAVVESQTKEEIDQTVNVMTTEETFKYLPSVLVRERFIGDRNAIVQGRVNAPIDSARTIVYEDGVLLSNYLNNSFANPPRWGMISPAEIERIDVVQGPLSALYGGNSIGGVFTVTTHMPDHFEVHASGNSGFQNFTWFQSNESNIAGDMNILIGDRFNQFSYWVSYDRLDAQGQSQTFSNNIFNTSLGSNKAISAFGGVFAADQSGNQNLIAGANGRDHNEQHMAKIKLAYDITPTSRLTWQTGFWSLVDNTYSTPYMYTWQGVPIYSLGKGAEIGLGPYGNYGPTLTSLEPGHSNASHIMNSAELRSDTRGLFDYDLVASQYNYLRDYTNSSIAYGLTPVASSNPRVPKYIINPAGTNTNQGGNFWRTFDARFIYRPEYDLFGKHILSFGGNDWLYSLNSVVTNTNVATSNYYNSISSISYGKTDYKGVYLQDEWKFLPQWRLTGGGRGDFWTAFNGTNNSLGKAVLYSPKSYKGVFEPKGALEYEVTPDFVVRGSIARNYRFPTVSELFQSISTPTSITINNPYLQPEASTYYDLTGEYQWRNAFGGNVDLVVPRVSLFEDDRWNFLFSQTGNISGVSVSQISNIGKVRIRGIESAVSMKNVVWQGLNLNGSVTFTDSRIVSDYQVPYYEGMQVPRIPRIRICATAVYAPTDQWSIAGGVRYASGSFVSAANTDFNHDNYGSTDSSYLVFDAKANYKFAPNWTATIGIDNIGNYKYLVNPNPYPERTYFLGVKYDLGGEEKGGAPTGVDTPRSSYASGSPAIQSR